MRTEYDFSGGERGKYAGKYAGLRMVALDPDVAASFPNAKSVNDALRALRAKPRRSTSTKRRAS
jgi:hypothetical protein